MAMEAIPSGSAVLDGGRKGRGGECPLAPPAGRRQTEMM